MIGTRLGAYEIVSEVGRGGMAVVYRAFQPAIDRFVAIKVILQNILSEPAAVERFRREARLIARLEHPHILPIYDFDSAHTPPYIVMRFLEGGTLRDVLERRRLPVGEISYVLKQVASALDYAHQQGIIHRDIKPSNIMIDQQGNTFVTDFGIARLSERGKGEITQTGVVVGTPDFMSPEQALGEETVDHRTDVYALGVVLFYMLTGELPFAAETSMALLLKHLQAPVPSAVALNPALPSTIDVVIAKAMSKSPDERYASAGEFAVAASEALSGGMFHTPINLRAAALETIVQSPDVEQLATVRHETPVEQNRVVTVLSANAADYAELVEEERGVEAARRATQAFWERAAQTIDGAGGIILERGETALMAVWGVDTGQENDPERAVRAALAVQDILRGSGVAVSGEEPLPLKIGVHTGATLIAVKSDTGTHTASGATIALASRLAEQAEGTILISPETFRAVAGIFDMQPADGLRVRGRKEVMQTYRVLSAKPRAYRLDLRGVEGIETQMIGRDTELKQMQNAFLTAFEDGETQIVTITGEAGVGKSRLLQAFRLWGELRPEQFVVFRGRATPDMRPYGLLHDILSFRFEILDSDSPAIVRQKMEAGVAWLLGKDKADDAASAHLMGQLVGFDFADSPHVAPLLGNPAALAESAQKAFEALLVGLASRQPVMFQLEDMHYADDASLDLLHSVASTHRELHLLLILLARPALTEQRPEWGADRELHISVHLEALSKRESRSLVREILQKIPDPPRALLDLIVDRAEGNPYYMEELVKMLIEDRVILKGDAAWTVQLERLAGLPVPTTLIGLLQTRLDTLLYPERVLLSRAAVFGRVFWENAIEALDSGDGVPIKNLSGVLKTLREREFIYPREASVFAGNREFAFAQAMLRDVVYEALLTRQRQAYHMAAAEWLVQAAGERAAEYIPIIAEHYEQAGENVRAAEYLVRAGERATAVSAYAEAIAVLERALRLLPEGEKLQRVRVGTQLAEIYSRKGALAEARTQADSALALAREIHDKRGMVDALAQLGRVCLWQGQIEQAQGYLEESLPLARELDDRPALIFTLRQLGNIALSVGHYDNASPYLEESLTLARADGALAAISSALNSLGIVASGRGNHLKALEHYREGLSIARQIGDKYPVAISLVNIGGEQLALRDYTAALQAGQDALAVAREIGSDSMLAGGLALVGAAQVGLGANAEAHEALDAALRLLHGSGEIPELLGLLPDYALLHARAGQPVRALELIGLVLAYPHTRDDARHNAERALSDIRASGALAGMDEAAIQVALTRGPDLDAIIQSLLNKAG